MKITSLLGSVLILVIITACGGSLPGATSQPGVTGTPSLPVETVSATATILWFPPTNTALISPVPTLLPTAQQRPGVGELLFLDDFDQPGLWNTASSPLASAQVTDHKLLLSISGQGPLSMVSLRQEPLLGDFYAEATATLSLCGKEDQFGMLFRAGAGENYYRLTLRCDGHLRLERSLNGSRSPLFNWQPSGDAPAAAPAQVKLGVWMAGTEIRIFLNDNLQVALQDSYLQQGSLGFFIYANGSSPITVSFSELAVYPVTFVLPTPTLPSIQTPTP